VNGSWHSSTRREIKNLEDPLMSQWQDELSMFFGVVVLHQTCSRSFWDNCSGGSFSDRGNLPAECYNPSGNMSLVTEDTVWKPPWLKVRT
jgi:hypothetical protein